MHDFIIGLSELEISLSVGSTMHCSEPLSLSKGASRIITLTVFKPDGTIQNLLGWGLEFQVKPRAGDADTELVFNKAVGTGITLLDQTVGGATEGQAQIAFVPADSSAAVAGNYDYDVVGIDPSANRIYLVEVSPFVVTSVVNEA